MLVFDVMLGKVVYYGDLPDTDDSLILVPFEVSAVLDDDIRTSFNLTTLKLWIPESTAGRITATDAYTGTGWAGLSNDGWLSPPFGPQITRVAVCYKPTSTAIDDDITPMVCLDVDFTPDSITDFSINLEDGYFEATGYTYV